LKLVKHNLPKGDTWLRAFLALKRHFRAIYNRPDLILIDVKVLARVLNVCRELKSNP